MVDYDASSSYFRSKVTRFVNRPLSEPAAWNTDWPEQYYEGTSLKFPCEVLWSMRLTFHQHP